MPTLQLSNIVIADQLLELGDAVAQPGIAIGQVPVVYGEIDNQTRVNGLYGAGRVLPGSIATDNAQTKSSASKPLNIAIEG